VTEEITGVPRVSPAVTPHPEPAPPGTWTTPAPPDQAEPVETPETPETPTEDAPDDGPEDAGTTDDG